MRAGSAAWRSRLRPRRASHGFYKIGDTIQATATLSENVTVTGSPQLALNLGGSAKTATYSSADSTSTALVFSYTVAVGDAAPNGVSIGAGSLTLPSGASILLTADNTAAALTHAAAGANANHKVDGVRPTFESARTNFNGKKVTVTFSENIGSVDLSGIKVNATSQFSNVAPTASTITGDSVELTLPSANTIQEGKTVTVTLAANAVGDRAGNGILAVSNQAVTNHSGTVDVTKLEGTVSMQNLGVYRKGHSQHVPVRTRFGLSNGYGRAGRPLAADLTVDVYWGSDPLQDENGDPYRITVPAGENHGYVTVVIPADDNDVYDLPEKRQLRALVDGVEIPWTPGVPRNTLAIYDDEPQPVVGIRAVNSKIVETNDIAVELTPSPRFGTTAKVALRIVDPLGVLKTSNLQREMVLSRNQKSSQFQAETNDIPADEGHASVRFYISRPAEFRDYYRIEQNAAEVHVRNYESSDPWPPTSAPLPTVSVADAEGTEEDGEIVFEVELSESSSQYVSLGYQTFEGTAVEGEDYERTAGKLTIAPGDTVATVSVPLIDDSHEDGGETFVFAVDFASGAVFGDARATGTILNTEQPDPESDPLTASFSGMPDSHDGSSEFSFTLTFSEEPDEDLSYETLRDDAFDVGGGDVRKARRQQQGSNRTWTIHIEPAGREAVTIRLPATTDCSASGAICTGDGRRLSNSPSATVAGPVEEPVGTNTAATGAPTISGTTQVGEQLRASTSDIADADGLDNPTFTYQWIRGGNDISGATGSTYTLVDADEGERIKVRVTFDDDAGNDESLTSAATDAVEPKPEPLTASFKNVPSEHGGGGTTFTFQLQFSENVDVSYKVLRDEAFDVTGGDVRKAQRVNGRDDLREIEVEASSNSAVSIRLPATSSCSASGAICTSDGRPLSHPLSTSVAGPAGLSVADAQAEENTDPSIDFTVSLDRAASGTVTVDYATADGTATAGADYTAASGTLTFQAGKRTKTVAVTLLDDTHDEGEETFTLTLSNASGAAITDSEATGTIENHDPMPRALLARFGRAAAVHVVEHVEERLQAPREPGFQGRFAGRELRKGMERDVALSFLSRLGGGAGMNPGAAATHGAMAGMPSHGAAGFGSAGLGGPGMGMAGRGSMMAGGAGPAHLGAVAGRGTMRGGMNAGSMQAGAGGMLGGSGLLQMGLGGGDVLTGSAFALNRETKSGSILSFWSRGAQSTFHGREGALSLNGDVRTTMFGADYAKGRMVTGLSLARSMSLGGYSAETAGQVESSVTGLYPWLGYQVTERVSVWGVAGYGAGSLLLTPGADMPLESALSMAMAAGGTRGDLIAGGTGGFALAFKADALWVGTSIDGVDGPAGRLKATGAAVTRFRTGLEGSRDYRMGNALSLKPLVEVGLRHDGGDAETGAGMDVGGGVMVASPGTGLAVDVRVRMLLVHQAEGFSERGMSVSLSYNPTPSTPLGFSARVAPSWGGQTTGGAEALWGRETMAGMAHGGVASGNRLDGEVGYGLPVGSRFVGTPRIGLTTSEYGQAYRVGYGMRVLEEGPVGLELGIDAQRSESPAAGGTSSGLLGQATLRW